jgi:hypothetical protein
VIEHPVAAKLWGPVIGPVISVLSFVCSIGNVPLTVEMWNGGISFGGVIAFIFADLIIIPILNIYRTCYGTRSAGWGLSPPNARPRSPRRASPGLLDRPEHHLPAAGRHVAGPLLPYRRRRDAQDEAPRCSKMMSGSRTSTKPHDHNGHDHQHAQPVAQAPHHRRRAEASHRAL